MAISPPLARSLAPLTVAADGGTVTVDAGGGPATVVCADVPTANATVHIIVTATGAFGDNPQVVA